ncbi:DUF4143 domain-containing protein [Agrobacterium salinitolerans]
MLKGGSLLGEKTGSVPRENQHSRLIKTPKLHFIDTGLLASMREDEAERLRLDRLRFGALLESFVVSELMKLASWSERRVSFSHYRTKDQDEVDVVIEDRRGRIIGIEVKASATVRAQDFRGLRQLQEAVGDRFVRGLVLHDHDRVTPFGEKLQAAPTSVLWTMLWQQGWNVADRAKLKCHLSLCQPVRNATLAPTASPRPDRLGRVARAGRGRVMEHPFGFSFLSVLAALRQ